MQKLKIVRYPFLAALVLVLLSSWVIFYVDPFLSKSSPVNADTLLVEAWVDAKYMPLAIQEFRKGKYNHIFVVGDSLAYDPKRQYKDGLEDITHTIIESGIDPSHVTAIRTPPKIWHKTWSQALAFRNYLARSNYPVKAINVFTLGVHARKSHLLYQRALRPGIKVGVISAIHCKRSYGPWWLTLSGIYGMFKNSIAYLDALLLTGWDDNGFINSKF